MMGIAIETPRLRLTAMTRSMVEDILYKSKEGVYQERPPWPTEDTLDILPLYMMELRENPRILGWGIWIILRKADGVVVGDAGFKGLPDEKGEIELGYGIVEGERSRGYGFEAAKALVKWGFTQERVKKIKAQCLKGNLPSGAILEKIGMHQVFEDEDMYFWEMENPQ